MRPVDHPPAGGLFLQVIDWLLAPLVVLWPTVVLGTYFATFALVNEPFDRELRGVALAVAEDALHPRTDAQGDAAYPALHAQRATPGERLYVQIAGDRGEVIAGDSALPPPQPADPASPGEVHLREAYVYDEKFRIAYVVLEPGDTGARLAQVGEPLSRRGAIAGRVTTVVMVVVAVLVPLTVGLVWLGLYRGLLPLRRLGAQIGQRKADDLSPIQPGDAPEEIAPLLKGLNAQLERVRQNLEAQRRFVGDAAHQLRTPLAGLKTQAQVALREQDGEALRDRLERIGESAARMARLVSQLLTLARADDARIRGLAFESVDLDGVLREVCAQAADEALARGATIAFDASGGQVRVAGAPLLLRELFTNLVDNAVRYAGAGGEVTVRVGPGAEVTVEDNGPGIAPAERELVFQRFYRTLGTEASGSGLGLPIVREIAELHGAAVRIENGAAGRGTRVRVAFPSPGKP